MIMRYLLKSKIYSKKNNMDNYTKIILPTYNRPNKFFKISNEIIYNILWNIKFIKENKI